MQKKVGAYSLRFPAEAGAAGAAETVAVLFRFLSPLPAGIVSHHTGGTLSPGIAVHLLQVVFPLGSLVAGREATFSLTVWILGFPQSPHSPWHHFSFSFWSALSPETPGPRCSKLLSLPRLVSVIASAQSFPPGGPEVSCCLCHLWNLRG